MPLKWKIYFACACYILLWAGFWFIDNLCDVIFKRNTDISGSVLMMLAMLAFIFISALPIRMIFHYRSGTHPTPNVKLLFITSHGFNIMAVLILSGIAFFTWLAGFDFVVGDVDSPLPVLEYLSVYTTTAAWLSCLILLIFSPALSKAIRDRYNATHTIKIDF